MDVLMRRVGNPTDQRHQRPERTPADNEPARFLRNLTSLPDADFASTYSPAIAAVFASYGDLPEPAAARRSLLLALKAGLKRRRAFILPRFTQAEDSWRIRECASYAVAIAILVEHACALLAPAPAERPNDLGVWPRILANPEIAPDPGGSSPQCTFFCAIVPAQGRRWIAREPLVQTLIASYFTATAPNELLEIVARSCPDSCSTARRLAWRPTTISRPSQSPSGILWPRRLPKSYRGCLAAPSTGPGPLLDVVQDHTPGPAAPTADTTRSPNRCHPTIPRSATKLRCWTRCPLTRPSKQKPSGNGSVCPTPRLPQHRRYLPL